MNIPLPFLIAAALTLVAVGAFMLGRRVVRDGAKPWWASRTVLFNALMAGLAGLEMHSSIVKGYLGPEAYAVFSVVVAMVNVYLRFGTTQPVK